jgi:phage tail protein X
VTEYVTIQNDRLDKICRQEYGTERNGNVERVLIANRGLSELGPILPAGVQITLPEGAPSIKTIPSVTLWN